MGGLKFSRQKKTSFEKPSLTRFNVLARSITKLLVKKRRVTSQRRESLSHCNKPKSCGLQANKLQVYNSASVKLHANKRECCKTVSLIFKPEKWSIQYFKEYAKYFFKFCILRFYISQHSCPTFTLQLTCENQEATTRRCCMKIAILNIQENIQENIHGRVLLLRKGLQLYQHCTTSRLCSCFFLQNF